jgi:photosystem II stability/assembly factor-like uncharacterized protein
LKQLIVEIVLVDLWIFVCVVVNSNSLMKSKGGLWVTILTASSIFLANWGAIAAEKEPERAAAMVVANNSWEVVTSPTTSRLMGIDAVVADDIWAVGGAYFNNEKPIVLHYVGGSWQIASTVDYSSQHLISVAFPNANNGWAAGYQMLSQYDSGAWTHEQQFMQFPYRIVMLDENTGWIVGFRYEFSGGLIHYGSIRRLQSGSWQEIGSRLDETYSDISMLNVNDGWIVGADGRLVIAAKIDDHYTRETQATDAIGGLILQRTQANPTWTEVMTTTATLYSVDAVSADDVWAVGDGGTILHYDGLNWTAVSSPTTNNLRRITMLSSDEGWIVGYSGTILYYTNGAWQTVSSPTLENLHDIDVLPSGEAWAVGDNGVILHYEPPATLTINYESGAPGSYFTITGGNFSPNNTATITINGHTLGSIPTDAQGSLTFWLNTTGAEIGAYLVTASVNPSANRWFNLDTAAPVRPQEGTGTTFMVPAGIAFDEFIYLPGIMK